jgi:hypothetical protein
MRQRFEGVQMKARVQFYAHVYTFSSQPVCHFSFLDRLALSVSMMRTAVIRYFTANAIQFEEVKASQSNGDSFRLNLCANVKVSMMVVR